MSFHLTHLHIVFLFILALPGTASALLLKPTDGIKAPVPIVGQMAVHCVANPEERIEEIATDERAQAFTELPALLIRGYTQETCWLRFQLQRTSEAPTTWFLETGIPILDDVVLYSPIPGSNGHAFSALRLGDRQAYVDRPIPHRQFVFPVSLPSEEVTSFYLRIRTSSTMVVDTANIWQHPGLLQQTQRESAVFWGVSGFIALAALSNLVFWFWLRERVYGLYTLYLAAFFLLTQTTNGLATQWLFSESPIVADRMMGVAISITYFIGLLFFDEVLGLRRHFPRIGKFFPVIGSIYLLTAFAAATGHYEKMVSVQQNVALLTTLGITVAGPWLIWKGIPNLRLYTLAFSTQLVGAVAVIGRNLGFWATTVPLDNFIQATTAVHVVLLNFVLADRIRRTQQARATMKKRAAQLESEQLALNQQQEFIAMVAHEFRTPLTVIDTCAQRIAGPSGGSVEKIHERCNNIRSAVQRLTALMDEFLTLDRLEGKIRQFSLESCCLDEIIDASVSEFPAQLINIHRKNLPETIIGDKTMLQIAVSNLLKNAQRFSKPGRQITLLIEGKAERNLVEFSVIDDGPGIPEDELPKLFQKFFRGRQGQSEPGAGLGLFLVDQVANIHGGSVSVKSRLGEGSRFTLTLPNSGRTKLAKQQI